MSKLLTIFLLLYGICQFTVSLGSEITPTLSDSISAENSNQNGYEKIIPADVDDVYHHGNLTTTAQFMSALAPFQDPSTIDHHVATEVFNLLTYKSAGREKRSRKAELRHAFFILRGKAISLPCWKSGALPFSAWHKDTKYIWRDAQNNLLANSRFQVRTYGRLFSRAAETSDTGKRSCQLKGTKKTSAYYKGMDLKTSTELIVFTIPTYELDISFLFDLASCSAQTKKKEITKEMRGILNSGSSVYPITITSRKCTPRKVQNSSPTGTYIVTATYRMPKDTALPTYSCNPKCIRSTMRKGLSMVKDFFVLKARKKYRLLKHSYAIKKWCGGGYWLYTNGICVPCTAGTYSKPKSMECSPCPRGQYQGQMAMAKCTKCSKGKSTKKKGSTSVSLCNARHVVTVRLSLNTMQLEHYIAIGAVPVIIILVFLLVCIIKCRKNGKEQKKELLLGQNNDEVNMEPTDQSDMERTTEIETDFKTPSGSDLGVDEVPEGSSLCRDEKRGSTDRNQ